MKLTTAELVAFAANICALIAFIKLFIKDKHKTEQLKLIEEQLVQLREQNKILSQSNQLRIQNRRNDMMPEFVFGLSSGTGMEFNFTLRNKGKNAKDVQFAGINTNRITIQQFKENYNIDSGQSININGVSNEHTGGLNVSALDCKITISFADIDGNKYIQEFTKIGGNVESDNPKEIN